ncbi:MAG TPA: ABC transporter transmembrane domain-containing protein, partial [Acidimicrobiales bacterium]|nr:ABC transporter transmembrane domain-containing protein [Acidimicrobiales bacterium]
MGQGMPGGGPWAMMRSFRRDPTVTRQKLAPGTLRRILRFAAPYRRLLISLVVMLGVDSAIGVVNPLLFREIIDRGIVRHDGNLVVVLAAVAAGLALVDLVLSLGERWFSSRIGEGLIYDMRTRVFSHIQRMPIAFFTRTQTGALVSRLDNDVLGAQSAFTGTFSSVVGNVLTVTFTLAAMFTLSWPITLVALLLLPVFVIPARRVGRRLQVITRESYNLNAAMTMTMTERFNVAGALLTKLYGRAAEEDGTFSRRAGRVRDIGVTSSMYAGVFFAALMLVAALATALVYGWGGWLAAHGALDVGTVVALTAYLTRLYGPLTSLSNVNVDVMTALVSFDRVFEVLDLPPMIDDPRDAAELPAGADTIEFDHVSFHYPTASEVSLASLEAVATLDHVPEREVLHDVSFRAAPGELVALVGPSGAGKTTISQLVTRMYDPTSGTVRVGGQDARAVTQ